MSIVWEFQEEISKEDSKTFNVEGCLVHTSISMGKIMLEIKEVNKDAFKHLIVIPPRQVFECYLSFCILSFIISIIWYVLQIDKRYWSRSRFNTSVKCDTLVNMLEAFNNMLMDARSEPIVTTLEDIRLYMMNRWASNRLKIHSFEGSICPKIRDKLNKEM